MSDSIWVTKVAVGSLPKVTVGIFHQCYHCAIQNLHIVTHTVCIQTFVLTNDNFVCTNCMVYICTYSVQLAFFAYYHTEDNIL